jgi:hypothetical protein
MAKKATGRKDYGVTPEQFIRAWEKARSAQEVADELGMPKAIVLARASTYRADGIKLKKMKRGNRKSLDIKGLNKLIEDLRESGESSLDE